MLSLLGEAALHDSAAANHSEMSRPLTLLASVSICLSFLLCCARESGSFQSRWESVPDRPWIGADYWSNPLQDWRIRAGRLENSSPGGDRNVFLLTRELGR